MECLLAICLIYLDGSIGVQRYPWIDQPYTYDSRSNHYGYRVGSMAIGIEFENNIYIEARHISGLDTFEADAGMNSLSLGVKIPIFRGDK